MVPLYFCTESSLGDLVPQRCGEQAVPIFSTERYLRGSISGGDALNVGAADDGDYFSG
jgi:hypothetical protein